AVAFLHASRNEQPDAIVFLVGHGDVRLDAGVERIELAAQNGAISLADPEASTHRQVASAGRGDEGRAALLAKLDLHTRIGIITLAEFELEAAAMTLGQKRQRERRRVD